MWNRKHNHRKLDQKIWQRNISQIKEQDKTQAEQLGEVETGNFIEYAKLFDCVDHTKLWKILKEMGIPDHLTCSWEICMQVRKQQLELDMDQQTGSK